MMPINEWHLIGGLAALTLALVFYTQGPIWWSGLRAMFKGATEAPAVLHGNGEHDDAPGLRAWLKGEPVRWAGGAPVERRLEGCSFLVESDWMIDPSEIDSPRHLVNCSIIDRRTGVSRQVMLLWGRSQAQ